MTQVIVKEKPFKCKAKGMKTVSTEGQQDAPTSQLLFSKSTFLGNHLLSSTHYFSFVFFNILNYF